MNKPRPQGQPPAQVKILHSALLAAALASTSAGSIAAVPNVSINSTSQDSDAPVTTVVSRRAIVPNNNYSILAINDLGMHCGDLDTRIASILPPFQVLLAQVVRKGPSPVLNPAGINLVYSATNNPRDPRRNRNDLLTGVKGDGTTYKTNFWDSVAQGAYDAFYPAFNPFDPAVTLTPLAGPPFNVTADRGLPVPNVEDLYIGRDGRVNSGDEELTATMHTMPGIADPYVVNRNRPVNERYLDKPFFVNFPFGYVANDVNWYEGAGIPFAAFDDVGRENPYPLVRVQARLGSTVVSSVDTVLPISGEASCANCHADPTDVQDSRTNRPTQTLRNAGLEVAVSLDDPDGNMPPDVSVEYASDINILRLHDLKHGKKYVTPSGDRAWCNVTARLPENSNGWKNCLSNQALQQKKPIVCQSCHYTPALDLAQLGPLAGDPGTVANGRNQLAHQSNSRVMHNHHGQFSNLFPNIPPPSQAANGTIRNQGARVAALENNCYQCHPGKNAQCLRGAMFNGEMLCSDCHGSLLQVGDDFSRDVSPSNPGAFILADDFYTNPSTPRVPWANEPGCGSCHTGDARNNLAGTARTIVNTRDSNGNVDGIRLRQAFRNGDAKATPIVPSNKRFAEPVVPAVFTQPGADFANPGAGNPKLYRVSTGHGGVMCEGCHGATHAEWPNAVPNANDNVTSNQLQGHTGTIIECDTCHGAGWEPSGNNALNGPHGIHVVGDTNFSDGGHENIAENNAGACFACHGGTDRDNSRGTVLSRAAADRTLQNDGNTVTVAKGQPVGCALCHD